MKNLSKRKRTTHYRELPKWQYRDSDNHKTVDELEDIKKLNLESMERRFNFLKRFRKDDKVLLSKCQKLIDLKKKLP